MEQILDTGIVIIVFLQGLGLWLVESMRLISYLGVEEFYLFVAPVVFWCVNATVGLRIGLGLMASNSLNTILKLLLHGPRPYWYSPEVKAFSSETSFGSPSAHAQNAVVVWGLLANSIKRSWAWILAIAIMLLTGISRLALGVHFPHDVLLGYLVGILVLWAFIALEKPVYTWLARKPVNTQIALSFAASIVILLAGMLARLSLGDWSVPASWSTLAAQAAPGSDPIAPLALSGLVSNAGVFFGLAWGAIWLKKGGWFDARGPAWQLIVRFLIGIAGVFVLWMGLGAVFPRGETLLPLLLRYTRYTLVGLWVAGIAPLLFIRLGLARKAG
ncbi:MAG: hypothetical protein A2Z16_16170 [Chloroflexi bacterium RBG_16_54_18]|nr:MAG: hypothetical protein A2Z16_16170 [Chloroflexi bacterium RBG_16_54_18]